MASLTNKRIVLGITGGIAAYKSADVARRLVEAGAEVRVIMTQGAMEFITPLTLQAVSGHAVHTELLDPEAERAMGHIELARWADAILIAPASANVIAKLTHGRADDLLSTVALASAAPLAIAPAMNQQMWHNPATQDNIDQLRARGIRLFGPGQGAQACGEIGPGRMLEAAELVALSAGLFDSGALQDRALLITAGPTWEAIDPVRGLTNRSSGKMGYALAEAAAEAGAQVTLISGPTQLPDPQRVTTVRVTSAQEMHDTVHQHIQGTDIFIGVAAVADYRPAQVSPHKIKKHEETLQLTLTRNPDILASVAALPQAPFCVGFAAETENLEAHARAKLTSKRLDMIIANPVDQADSGFDADDNQVWLIDQQDTLALPRQRKTQLARDLIQHIAKKYDEKYPAKDSRRTHRQ